MRIARYGGAIGHIRRLAITSEDTAQTTLPWFPAISRRKDPRFEWYARRYGQRCWELDALSPAFSVPALRRRLPGRIDMEAWGRAEVVERAELDSPVTVLTAWPGISRQASQ